MKNAIKELKQFVHKAQKDWLLSGLLFFAILGFYLPSQCETPPKIKPSHSKNYIITGKYHLSNMSLQQIDALPNISKKQAKLIYKNRKNIKKYSDFLKLKGIGKKKLETLKTYILLKKEDQIK